MLTFDPYISLALWLPLVVVAIVLVAWYAINSRGRVAARRRWTIVGLMSLAISVPLFILLNPTWEERIPPPAGKPRLTILLDRSASMATASANGDSTRFEDATAEARRIATVLDDQFEVRTHVFAEAWQLADLTTLDSLQPEGAMTDVGRAIDDALEDCPQGQALLLLSDGIHNTAGGTNVVRASSEKARAMAAPIFTRAIGGVSTVRDLEAIVGLPQEMAFIEQEVPVTVTIKQRGIVTDRTNVSLAVDGEVIDEQTVELMSNGETDVTFRVQQAKKGVYRYDVRVAESPVEVTTLNNQATMLLRVVDEPVRVLLLEGKPYWDTKFLVRTLSLDQSIDLLTKPRVLDAYQIVILGRDAEVYLNDHVLRELKRWLAEDEGSLVCARGAPSSQVSQRLGDLMPVKWSPAREARFRVQMTRSGKSLQWLPTSNDDDLLTQLPSLATVTQAEKPKPLAVVLATSSGEADAPNPVISYQPVGSGRVVVVEGAGMWRWAFLPPEFEQHDEVYGVLWRSLVRWLVSNAGLLPSQEIALRSDKVIFSEGEVATGTMLLRDRSLTSPPMVELRGGPEETSQELTPVQVGDVAGQYRVVFGKLPEGRYEATVQGGAGDGAEQAVFDVRGSFTERLDVASRPDLMKMVANSSGGAVVDGASVDDLREKLDEHLAATLPLRTSRVMAWDRYWVLLAVLGLWAATWILRRSSGLV